MSVAFWSAEVKAGKKFTFQPPEGYVLNLQNVALADAEKGEGMKCFVSTENIDGDIKKVLLATLRGHGTEQYQTSLVFGYDVPVEFQASGKGSGSVHFSGYIQPGPMEGDEDDDEYGDDDWDDNEDAERLREAMMDMDSDEEYSDDSESTEPRVEELSSESDEAPAQGKNNKKRQLKEANSDSEGDTASDDEDNMLDEAFINKMIKKHHEPEQKPVSNKGSKGGDGAADSGKKKKNKGKGKK